MDSKFALLRLGIEAGDEIAISGERFQALRTARDGISRMLGVEEKFDTLMGNYAELEAELLTLAAEALLFTELSWDHMMGVLALVNRRLLNVFSAARMYLDHVPHDLSAMSLERATFKSATGAQYDAHLGYRVMEALRNYAQHRGVAANSLSYAWSRNDGTGRTHTIEFSLKMADLQADGEFKKKVLDELVALKSPEVSLKAPLREYMASLNAIHRSVRQTTGQVVDQWNSMLNVALDECRARFGTDAVGLAAARIRLENGEPRGLLDSIYLLEDPWRRLNRLAQRNRCSPGFEVHSVSSR